MVNQFPSALFSIFKLTRSSEKHFEDNSHAHLVSLMSKLKTNARYTDVLSVSFDRDRNSRQQELTNDNNKKAKFYVRIRLRDVFGFVENQEGATYGLGYKLTLTRNEDEAIINKTASTADARIKIDHIHRYAPHYTPSIQQQGALSKQILSKTPTEPGYNERTVYERTK